MIAPVIKDIPKNLGNIRDSTEEDVVSFVEDILTKAVVIPIPLVTSTFCLIETCSTLGMLSSENR